MLEYASDDLVNDKEFLYPVLQDKRFSLDLVSHDLKNNKNFMLACVK